MAESVSSVEEGIFHEELERRYLAYALSTIISRSLPDVRDGLKPVHRRILFAMEALGLAAKSPFKKSARVVGDVIGKFHPHGDQAAYDAMVRLAQEFAARYPLVEGQGNFGNVDGDSAAAMRYTEARLTRVAEALLEGLDEDCVDFIPTYDGSLQEPLVLPARFPNLLANGATGIAVGMSTAIPPHNVGEILEACLHLLDHPEASVLDLMRFVPGPDFPTGGVLVSEEEDLRTAYQEGRGSLRLRARIEREELKRGQWHLVVREIPYQVQKARLIENIARQIVEKKCLFLEDIRDESDETLRIVLEPRNRSIDPELVQAYLFKHTDLEVRIPVNFNVITAATRPEVMDLKGLLMAWLDHRFQVQTRRDSHELAKLRERLHLLAAYLLVHLNIDEVIAIIKESEDPAPRLMERFGLDAGQAEAILNLRLRALRRLEEMLIRQEMAQKEERARELEGRLADEVRMWNVIRLDLKQTKESFADARRTRIEVAVTQVELKPADLVDREPVTLILSDKGWVRLLKGHDDLDPQKLRFKGDDQLSLMVRTHAHRTVTWVMASGRVYSLMADRIDSAKRTGEPLTMFFDLEPEDPVAWMMEVDEEKEYFISTELGQGMRLQGVHLVSNQRKGKQLFSWNPGDRLLHILPVSGDHVACIHSGRRLLVCPLETFPKASGGKGVRICRLNKGEVVVDVTTFEVEKGVHLDSGKRQKHILPLDPWLGARGGRGAVLPHGFLGGAVFPGTGVVPRAVRQGDLFYGELA
ncbi:MAG: DNA topoisomerase IV subunit A [Magnetococcales bacterium]|nr:DNA topoisomerase IV subunit A [Magnetococcales bacterium]